MSMYYFYNKNVNFFKGGNSEVSETIFLTSYFSKWDIKTLKNINYFSACVDNVYIREIKRNFTFRKAILNYNEVL